MNTARCMECGCPEIDHVPAIRYPLRAWARHRFLHLLNLIPLKRINDTSIDF